MKLQLAHETLDEFYEWLEGPAIMRKRPSPTPRVLIEAERAFWREISIRVHGGQVLKSAMDELRKDGLFWTRELYDKCKRDDDGSGEYYGARKGKAKGNERGAPYQPPAKDVAKGGGKKGSRSPGERTYSPADVKEKWRTGEWVQEMPNRKESCLKYICGTCWGPSGSCGRSRFV